MNQNELEMLELRYCRSEDTPMEALERAQKELEDFNDCYEEEQNRHKHILPGLCDNLLSELDNIEIAFANTLEQVKAEIEVVEDAEKREKAKKRCKKAEPKLKTENADFKEIIHASEDARKGQPK
jgi:hypothetical protein